MRAAPVTSAALTSTLTVTDTVTPANYTLAHVRQRD